MEGASDIKQLLINQANLLFKRLANKHHELNNVERELLDCLHENRGATTVFKDLHTHIYGLNEIIKTAATSFGVSTKDLRSQIFFWENELEKKKIDNNPPCALVAPETSASQILEDVALKGLFHLPVFDIRAIYKLWNVKKILVHNTSLLVQR